MHVCACQTLRLDGAKYKPRELFDITRRPLTLATDESGSTSQADSCLQVDVPCDLMRRTTIGVSIEIGAQVFLDTAIADIVRYDYADLVTV